MRKLVKLNCYASKHQLYTFNYEWRRTYWRKYPLIIHVVVCLCEFDEACFSYRYQKEH
jgi:hypothetical protein